MNKIKEFFMKLFGKKQKMLEEGKINRENISMTDNGKEDFINNLKSKYVNSEEEKTIRLFQLFDSYKIKEEDLTKEQYAKISEMYDIKIAEEKRKIEYLNKKLLKYKKEA